ncbi:ribonucleoside triphosphate reductase [Patescibacteria group bacterium]
MSKLVQQITKRDGREMRFDPAKITSAVFKAFRAVGEPDTKEAEKITEIVVKKLNKKFDGHTIPTVEQVQDMVEEALIEKNKTKAAKAYIIYRDQHKKLRELDSYINSDDIIENYLNKDDWRVKENSNMTYSLQGLNNHLASAVSANYWLNKIYSQEIKEAHENADLHIHDLQLLASYCCGWDLKDLLMRGFGGVPGKIHCSPPMHLSAALGQVVNYFYTLQGEANGAQAFSSFDTYLAPFIRYDGLTYRQVKQKLQSFMFNMNVPTRVGFQTPFTNITLDLKPSGMVAEENIIIKGKVKNEKYKNFQPEIDMFNKALAEVYTDGDAQGRVFTFPIPTYNITKDLDWDNEVLNSVWEMTAKYGIPYFANYVNSDMSPDDTRSMCCRLRLDNRELRKRGGGLFGANPLTGSIGVVTINMARLGYLSKTKEEFKDKLIRLMDIAKESLDVKREMIEKFTDMQLYPYSAYFLDTVKEVSGKYWSNHFSTIGINGMNEACINFMSKNLTTKEGKDFALEIMDFMRERMIKYQEETGILFNLEATPAEGTAYRFAWNDKQKFSDIIVANEEAYQEKGVKPYYTNSSHLPVGFTDDLFEALELQDDLQCKYTGGTVLHIFLGEKLPSIEITKKLVKKISEKYHLPYFSITPTFSICPKHGYFAGEHEYCPACDEEIGYNPDFEDKGFKIEQDKLF